MKMKTYIKPDIDILRIHGEQMLAASGIKSFNNGVNISYGGVDEDGSLEADVKGESNFDFSWE